MEGPSIVILVEEANKFVGKRVSKSSGSTKLIDIRALKGQKLVALKSWGKHFLLLFEKTTLKVHFMMFGSYRIDDAKPGFKPRLALRFKTGEIFMYACSIRQITQPLSSLYDWRADVMSDYWDEKLALRKLQKLVEKNKSTLVCDALLDQEIFGGAGNIIKNEVLFRMRLHPETKLRALSKEELLLLIRETKVYCLQFYIWKKQFLLRKHWLIYRQRICSACQAKVQIKPTGKFERRSFICPQCQPIRMKRRTINLKSKLTKAKTQIASLRKEMPRIISGGPVEKEH